MIEDVIYLNEVEFSMTKVKRNDPCPCGSGKKYKKCCMNKQQAASSATRKDEKDYQDFLPRVVEFSRPYEEKIQQAIWNDVKEFSVLEEADQKAFVQSASLWSLFNAKVIDDQSVVQAYLNEYQDDYSEAFSTFLTQWRTIRPGLYSVKDVKGKHVTIMDWFAKAHITLEMTPTTKQLSEDDLIIGYLYPTLKGYELGSDIMIIPETFKDSFVYEWNRFYQLFGYENESERDLLTRAYPAALHILAGILNQMVLSINDEVLTENGEEAFRLFTQNLAVDSVPYSDLLFARLVWTEYVEKTSPKVTKPEIFAATLEYWLHQYSEAAEKVSQKAIAEKYKVSPSTISSKYKQIAELIKIDD